MPRYKQEGIEIARVGVVLPKEVRLRLEQVAATRGWSLSQTAASAIEEWLDLVETPSPANQNQGAA